MSGMALVFEGLVALTVCVLTRLPGMASELSEQHGLSS